MSQSVRDFEKSGTADAAIAQFLAVKITSTGYDVAATDTSLTVGVSQNTVATGEQVCFRFAGTTKITAGGTISRGDLLVPTTAGKVIATTTDHKLVVGRALEDAVTGDVFECLLMPGAMVSL